MKGKVTSIFLAAMFLAVPVVTSAYYVESTVNTAPGASNYVTVSNVNPTSCSGMGQTPSSSNDHIKVTMTHIEGSNVFDWGNQVEIYSTTPTAEYWTQTFNDVDCEPYDGARVYNYNSFTPIPLRVVYSLIG